MRRLAKAAGRSLRSEGSAREDTSLEACGALITGVGGKPLEA
jgi:hypothetical protein